MIDEILKRLNKEFDNDLDNYEQERYAGYMYAIGVAIEIVEEVKRGSKWILKTLNVLFQNI